MFGDKLKDLRMKKGLKQEEMANILNTKSSTYGYWERNQTQPDYETLEKIAKYFNVSLDYLIIDDDDKDKFERLKQLLVENGYMAGSDLTKDEFNFIMNQLEALKDFNKKDITQQ